MRTVCSEILFVPAFLFSLSGQLCQATAAPAPRLEKIRKRLPAKVVAVENSCLPPASAGTPGCTTALDKTRSKLRRLASGEDARFRILHLGDSHIASDYITGEIRRALQTKYGDAGRGFVQIDQLVEYGGRRKKRSDRDWTLDRIVDTGREGLPFGFSGVSIESKKKGALATYALSSEDQKIRIYYQAQPGGSKLRVNVRGKEIGVIDTAATEAAGLVAEFVLPESSGPGAKGKKKPKASAGLLEIVAEAPKVRLYGISFERTSRGVLYDAIGPVGADAKVYLDLDRKSFVDHLALHRPDLIVLMVGGNDALKIRKEWTDPGRVRKDHQELIDVLRRTLPESECLVWSPMDAGERQGKRVVSKPKLDEVRAIQREVAQEKGCGFWDFYESMGGTNAIAAWHAAGVMNTDLVHPKALAADLLGSLFVDGLELFLAAP